jgi:Flp pilus assembly protein TadG
MRRRRSSEAGTSTLEFVVVLPVLLLILFGIAELSRAWLTLNLVTTAAREGARAGAVAPPDQVAAVASARINEILGAGNWTGSVTCSPNPCAPDATVQASVAVTFNTVLPILLPMLETMNIQQTASMRYE